MDTPQQPWSPQQSWTPPPGPAWYPPRPGPSVGWAVALWVLAGLTALGTLLCSVTAAYGWWVHQHMQDEGVAVEATVAYADSLTTTVEFTTTAGDEVVADLQWGPTPTPSSGDVIGVVYDPDDETYVIEEGSQGDRYVAIGFTVAAGVGLLVILGSVIGAILVHRARARARNTLASSWPPAPQSRP